jgi:benzoyl-CoA reductase subunit B
MPPVKPPSLDLQSNLLPKKETSMLTEVKSSEKKANKLQSTRQAGQMVNDYWQDLFTAKEQGKQVVWYEGSALNPFFQAAGVAWTHGEAYSAMLAARKLELPAQQAAEERGYMRELCSYARTHLGCQVLSQRTAEQDLALVNLVDPKTMADKLPAPDFFINAYAYCSTGQQWDEMSFRLFGKKVPIFNVSIPFLWGNKLDARYLSGSEWNEASQYVAKQLREMVKFIEERTGRKFDYDKLSENMSYIKRASELRLEGMDLCTRGPTPATFWDWIASIAPINFLPANQGLVNYFEGVLAEIQQRVASGESAVPNEKYRLFFDGMMNWNRLGWLAEKFAKYDAAVIAGRYTHMAFWQEPHLIDVSDPILGMAQHYLICPNNHGANMLTDEVMKLCEKFRIDGMVFHVSRTCRAFTNPQNLFADAAHKRLGIPTAMFEGDVTDDSFYKDEMLNSRVEAMFEAIDARRMAGS